MACGTFLLPPQLELEYNLDWQLTVLAYGRFLQQLRSTGDWAVLCRLWRGFSLAILPCPAAAFPGAARALPCRACSRGWGIGR